MADEPPSLGILFGNLLKVNYWSGRNERAATVATTVTAAAATVLITAEPGIFA